MSSVTWRAAARPSAQPLGRRNVDGVKRLSRQSEVRENLARRRRKSGTPRRGSMLSSEAFAMTFQRGGPQSICRSGRWRCNVSATASLDEAGDRSRRGAAPGDRSLERRSPRPIEDARRVARPNKSIQRTALIVASIRQRPRAAADRRRYAPSGGCVTAGSCAVAPATV